MTQIVFTKAKFIPWLLVVLPCFGSLVSYYVAVRLNHVKPFLPFLSHAAGYPPQAAVFSCALEVTAALGILTSVLRHIAVKERKSFLPQETVKKLSSIALWIGCLAFLGLIYTAVNPIGFPAPDKQDYMWYVFLNHNVGSFTAMFCFDIYVLIQSYLAYNQTEIYKGNTVVLILLAVPIVTMSLIISGTFYFVVEDMLDHIVVVKKITGFATLSNTQYNFFPLLDAILEWILAVFIFAYLATFSTDFKYMTIKLQLQPKYAFSEERTVSALNSPSANSHLKRRCFDNVISTENEKKRQ